MTLQNRASEEELHGRIATGSRDVDDFRQLASLLTDAGETRAAIDLLEQGLALASAALDRANLVAQLAWLLYERTTKLERARVLANDGLRHLTGELETPDVLFARGVLQSLLAHERFTVDPRSGTEMARVAVATFERLFSEAPDWDDEEAWLEAARLYCFVGDGERAIPLVRRFLEVGADECRRLDGLLILADAQRLAGVLADAETVAAEALRLARDQHPDFVHNAAQGLGLIQKASGRLPEARESFEEALAALDRHHGVAQQDPEWRKTVHGNLAEIYGALGEHNKAVSAWHELLRWYADDDPGRSGILLCLAAACDAAGELTAARTWYETVLTAPLASSEDRAEAQVWLLWSEGRIQSRSGEHQAAARTFRRLLDRYRDDDADRRNVLGWLGDSYYAAGDFAQALEPYEEIARSPRASEEERKRGRLWAGQSRARNNYEIGRYADAAQSFERLFDNTSDGPGRYHWLLWLAACYFRMGAYANAKRCYEDVLDAVDATEDQRSGATRSLAILDSELG